MKEVDPEVAALLDDLPRSKLPEVLVKEGWGQQTMARALRSPLGARLLKPSTTQQPDYSTHCVQCGRPITYSDSRRGLIDHAGQAECDGAIIDDRASRWHCDATAYEHALRDRDQTKTRQQELLKLEAEATRRRLVNRAARANTACSATKRSHNHMHICSQTGLDHFGFHECVICRALWK